MRQPPFGALIWMIYCNCFLLFMYLYIYKMAACRMKRFCVEWQHCQDYRGFQSEGKRQDDLDEIAANEK